MKPAMEYVVDAMRDLDTIPTEIKVIARSEEEAIRYVRDTLPVMEEENESYLLGRPFTEEERNRRKKWIHFTVRKTREIQTPLIVAKKY